MEGEAAFYGPKIDVHIEDAIGRPWQLTTVQFDFNLPDRFGLEYVGPDGKPHRPIMIHRALFGSLERFFGVLIEHYAGAFPVWLAPVQVAALTVADRVAPYAERVVGALRQSGLRAELNARGDTIGAKIREAQLQKIPFHARPRRSRSRSRDGLRARAFARQRRGHASGGVRRDGAPTDPITRRVPGVAGARDRVTDQRNRAGRYGASRGSGTPSSSSAAATRPQRVSRSKR